jgi:DNA-binding transcriptional LysR family regulator
MKQGGYMQNSELDFNQLKKLWTLKLVVEGGGLRQAATRSKVSVSAISQVLTNLEKNLGRSLFLRKDRKLFPTTFCIEILGAIEPAFKTFSELQSIKIPTCEIPKLAWLDFGVSDCVAVNILPGLVTQLTKKLPQMKLKLRVGKSVELTRLVKNGGLCMALVTENDSIKGISSYPIFKDRLGLYSAAHGWASASNFESAQESGIASILPGGEGHPLYYSRFLKALNCSFRRSLASDSYETLYSIAASGTMPAVLPSRMALRVPGLLREIPLPEAVIGKKPPGEFDICLVSQKSCDPIEDQFLISELKSLL